MQHMVSLVQLGVLRSVRAGGVLTLISNQMQGTTIHKPLFSLKRIHELFYQMDTQSVFYKLEIVWKCGAQMNPTC